MVESSSNSDDFQELNKLVMELKQRVKDRDVEIAGWKAGAARRKDKEILRFSQSLDIPANGGGVVDPFSTPKGAMTPRIVELQRTISIAEEEESLWTVDVESMINPTFMSEHQMRMIFDQFDCDGGGSIDATELQYAFSSMDQDFSRQRIDNMIEEIDADGNFINQ